MNKKTLVAIGVVLLLSTVNIGMVILPVGAAVNEQGNSIHMNPGGNGGNSIYDLLIIAPGKFTSALQPLVVHKNDVAEVSTILVTTSEIYDGDYFPVEGRDKPEKIKYFIKNAYDEWGIKYVLLVGMDIPLFRDVPVRYCYNSDVGTGFDEPYFISDLYYADIYDQYGEFSSWDTDNDGIFGEWYMYEPAEDNNIDLYPDVYVGRLPCKFKSQVKTVVNKIIKYETTTYGESWFKNIIGVSGDTYVDGHWRFPTPGYEGEENVLRAFENMSNIGFDPTYVFVSDGSFSGPKDIRREVNKGAGFLFLDGHSSPASWACKDEDGWIDGIGLLDLSAYLFSNKEKLPVTIWGGCHTFQFDVGPWQIFNDPNWNLHLTWVWECLAWSVVRLPYGGAIAAIGCTGLGLTKEDRDDCWQRDNTTFPTEGCGDFIDPQFFFRYINDGGSTSGSDILLGEMMGNTVSDYLDYFPINWSQCATNDSADDAKTVQQWVLFGDPSLKIGGYDVEGGGSEFEVEVVVANAERSSVSGYVGAPVQFQGTASGGTGSYVYEWQFEGGVAVGNIGETVECTWFSPGVYQVTVMVTDVMGEECTYDTFVNIESVPDTPSEPASVPDAPFGPTSGEPGVEYTFTALVTGSPSQDWVCYLFDWGGDETYSDPVGPYPRDQIAEAKYVWSNPGQYRVRVKAWLLDTENNLYEETGWSDPITITISKNQQINQQSSNPLFFQILERLASIR